MHAEYDADEIERRKTSGQPGRTTAEIFKSLRASADS
jgi:hypothetical protein